MQLPKKQSLKENVVVTSKGELKDLVSEALAGSSGAFMKIFGRDSKNKYYVTVLFDRSKVLAVECLVVDERRDLTGEEAISVLKSLMENPMVVDVYALDELETKLSIADNVEVYAQTPKVSLTELFGEVSIPEEAEQAVPAEAPVEEKPPSKPSLKKKSSKREEAVVEPKPAKKSKPAPPKQKKAPKTPKQSVPSEPEVVVHFTRGSLPEKAFKDYGEALLKEAKRIKNLNVHRIEFDADVVEGVVYLNVKVHGTSSGTARDIEVAEKRLLHAVSKHAPIILKEAEVKPIIRDVAVVIDGKEVKPQEIVNKDKKRSGNVTKDGKISLSVLEDVWTYFSAYARTVVKDITAAGIKVDKAYFDVKGRREFEINLSAAVESSMPKEDVVRTIRDILSRHAKELSSSINKYITVHTVDVEVISHAKQASTSTSSSTAPKVTSAKAAEVLAKKEALEKEVEKLLKEAGIEDFAPLTEEKKKEAEETALKAKIEPAIDALKSRIHTELKLIPRVTFKWLKLNHEIQNNKILLDVEASFLRESTGGLFGSYSGVPDEKIKQDVAEMIQRIVREVSREYGVSATVRKLKVVIH